MNLENLDEIESQGFSSASKRKSNKFDSFNRKSGSKVPETQRPTNHSTESSKGAPTHTQNSKRRYRLRQRLLRGFSSKATPMSSSKFSVKTDYGPKYSNLWGARSFVPERKWTLGGMWKKEKKPKLASIQKLLSSKPGKAEAKESLNSRPRKLSKKGNE